MSGESICKSVSIRVEGIVQGVGFRPFVYGLAHTLDLKGYVLNDAQGVEIVLEGGRVERFVQRLQNELPPLARIDKLSVNERDYYGYDTFVIQLSNIGETRSAAISPDMALCTNCLREMRDETDRRHNYFLINCTDCGPRYSIIETVPYDRPNTSMKAFQMCGACRKEYENPLDRRYHAQPISCPDCGPKLFFQRGHDKSEGEAALAFAIEALKAGEIVAVKGLGGFHLMCDATDACAVARLRERKRRPSKPFAVMFASMAMLGASAQPDDAERRLIDSKERPVVLVAAHKGAVAESVAPGIGRLGVFLPYTPLHYLLFEQIDFPLVATSANMSDEPIIRTHDELIGKLSHVADAVLSHDRDIVNACDDSVMQVVNGCSLMLRLARGFAPLTMKLPKKVNQKILAVGANQKNAIALAWDDTMILSPHIGDLNSIEAFEYFERTVETFKRFYDFEPDVIVCDMHPGYETTKWALRQGKTVVRVQHHHAHILSVMLEHTIDKAVLGFAFDGTGYGDDGTIWGGEVLLCRGSEYERLFHLKPFRLLGGEKAVKEPRRAALGLLFEYCTLDEVLAMENPTVRAFTPSEIKTLHKAWEKGINSPLCSSMGRLFDAVASLSGICQRVSYEGESGLLMEAQFAPEAAEPFDFTLEGGIIDFEPMLQTLAKGETTAQTITSRFIATVAEIMVHIAKSRNEPVVLSGGVFQNRRLLESVCGRFDTEGITYYLPSRFPVNDGCIAAGQIAVLI